MKLKHMEVLVWIAALLLFFLVGAAWAGTIEWTNATKRENGAALPLSEISYIDIQWGTCNGLSFGDLLGSAQVPPLPSVFQQALPSPSCVQAFTVDTGGLRSGPSAVLSYITQSNPPDAPDILHVIWGAAFKVKVMPNGRIFLPYETGASARYGAPCLAIPGLYEVYGFGLSEGIIAICGP